MARSSGLPLRLPAFLSKTPTAARIEAGLSRSFRVAYTSGGLTLLGVLLLFLLRSDVEPLPAASRRSPTAAELGAAGSVSPTPERFAAAKELSLRLVSEVDGHPVPDHLVGLTALDEVGMSYAMRSQGGVVRVAAAPGRFRLVSDPDAPCFVEREIEVFDSPQDVAVVPLVRLSIHAQDEAGERIDAAANALRFGLVQAQEVAAALAEASGSISPDRLAALEARPVRDGDLVAAWPEVCLLATGAMRARVMPAHAAWYGQRHVRGFSTPVARGSECPVSAPVAGTPGGEFKVVVVAARSGIVEVDIRGLPSGKTSLVARRAGFAGTDSASHSWKIAKQVVVGVAATERPDAVRIEDLSPGTYKIDIVVDGLEQVTCAVLAATVEGGQTVYVTADRGIGPGVLILDSVPSGAVVRGFFPIEALVAWSEAGPAWNQTLQFGGERFAPTAGGRVLLRGLHADRGTLNVTAGDTTQSIEVDLRKVGVYHVTPPQTVRRPYK